MKRRRFLGTAAALLPVSVCRAEPVQGNREGPQEQSEQGVRIQEESSPLMRGYPPAPELVVRVEDLHASDDDKRVWAQQHVRELCSTQEISRGNGPVAILHRNTQDLDEMTVRVGDGKTTLRQLLDVTLTDAFVVLHRGKIITEQYFAGMRPDTPHLLWSCSKSISVGVVANLLQQNRLKRDESVTMYIPELIGCAYDGCTIRHLLDMKSNVKYRFGSDAVSMQRHTSVNECGRHYRSAGMYPKLVGEELVGQYSFLQNMEVDKELGTHGATFCYKDSDSAVLAWACEKVTGERFADLVSKFIWSLLGAEHSGSIVCGPQGGSTPAAGMSVTLRDFARWGQMHLQLGSWNGQQVVPAEFVRGVKNYSGKLTFGKTSYPPPEALLSGTTYHDQFWMGSANENAFFAIGHCGQFCYVYPKFETVITRFATEKELEPQYQRLLPAFAEVARALAT